jgi:transcriptional regulator GlxA family with amidase domain
MQDRAEDVAVLLLDGFSNHCLANAVEPLRAANGLARRRLYRWRFVTPDGAPVASSSGLPVAAAGRLRDDPGGDLLMVVAGYGARAQAGPETGAALRAAAGRFRAVAGLDTGAWLLAAAGLLDGRRAVIHWDEADAFAEAFPEVRAEPGRVAIDGDRLTCGGGLTAFELALALIGARHGAMLRLEVAGLFMHGEGRAAPAGPARGATDAAAAVMRRNLETLLGVDEIAQACGMGRKRLEAAFRRELDRTPREIYRRLRLREARRLVEGTALGVAEIAARCGYADASAMTRAYRAEFGESPRAARGRR